jgi:hypothetical protein
MTGVDHDADPLDEKGSIGLRAEHLSHGVEGLRIIYDTKEKPKNHCLCNFFIDMRSNTEHNFVQNLNTLNFSPSVGLLGRWTNRTFTSSG